MFLRHARATRLAAVYLLFVVALVMMPKPDLPETLLDESNTPTTEAVVQKAASLWEYRHSPIAFVPRIFAEPRTARVRRIVSVSASQLTDCHLLQKLLASFLC